MDMKKTTIELIQKLGFDDRTDVSIDESICLRRPEDGFTIEVTEADWGIGGIQTMFRTFIATLDEVKEFFTDCRTLKGYLSFVGYKDIPDNLDNNYLSGEISSINSWDGTFSGDQHWQSEDDLVEELEQRYKVSADVEE